MRSRNPDIRKGSVRSTDASQHAPRSKDLGNPGALAFRSGVGITDPETPWDSGKDRLEGGVPRPQIPTCSGTRMGQPSGRSPGSIGPGMLRDYGASRDPTRAHLEGAVELVAHPPELAAISLCSPEVGGRRARAAPEGAGLLLLRPCFILRPRGVEAVATPGLHSPSACRGRQGVGTT